EFDAISGVAGNDDRLAVGDDGIHAARSDVCGLRQLGSHAALARDGHDVPGIVEAGRIEDAWLDRRQQSQPGQLGSYTAFGVVAKGGSLDLDSNFAIQISVARRLLRDVSDPAHSFLPFL